MAQALTLEEMTNLTVDEIILKVVDEPTVNWIQIKKHLKGFYRTNPEGIVLNAQLIVDELPFRIVKIVHATDRVFFSLEHKDKSISVSRSYLLGVQPVFPFQHGDIVTHNGDEKLVVGINPASSTVKLKWLDKVQNFNIKHVQKAQDQVVEAKVIED